MNGKVLKLKLDIEKECDSISLEFLLLLLWWVLVINGLVGLQFKMNYVANPICLSADLCTLKMESLIKGVGLGQGFVSLTNVLLWRVPCVL